jgi:transposase
VKYYYCDEYENVDGYKREKKKAGRKPLSENLPRVEKLIDIPDDQKTCDCGASLKRIGEDKSERLIIEEPKIYVEVTVRPKYTCSECKGKCHANGDSDKKTEAIIQKI